MWDEGVRKPCQEKEAAMGCEKVKVVLKLPEPVNKAEAEAWESVNRPPNMLWLLELEPVGPEPTAEWNALYEECDEVTAGLCS